jgi:hypothetical protein
MKVNNILAESAGFNKRMSEETKGIVSKWAKTGLLEGLSSDFEKSGMATLLENQAKQLVSEASATGLSANSEEWSGVALPLVRRIFSEIAAKEFVSVQPMNLPSGLVFYLDFKYGTGQPGFTTGSGKNSQADSVFGITETGSNATGGLYGDGRFGYTINETQSAALGYGSLGASNVATSSLSESDYNFDTAWSASVYVNYPGTTGGVSIHTLSVSASSISGFDSNGVKAFQPVGAAVTAYYPQFTTYNSTTQVVKFVVLGDVDNSDTVVIKYQKQPTDITRGDFEQTAAGFRENPETDLGIPELNVELRSIPIVAKTRKLKAQWTPEFAQDLNAYHSIDAEAELTSMLSEYISQEIDLEILDMLQQNALTTGHWSAKVGYEWNGTTFAQSAANYTAYIQGTWFATLGTVLQRVSNQIHAKTMRGGANFLVVSPDVATILESIPGYTANGTGEAMQFAMGVSQVGSFANRYTVYKNPYMQSNMILMGFKGAQFLETGAVYAPYIPLIMTPLVYDPKNFQPRKGVMTRYAKEMIRGEFYGKVFVHGLETVGQ